MNLPRAYFDSFISLQRARISLENKQGAVGRGVDEATEAQMLDLKNLHAKIMALEEETDSKLKNMGLAMPIVQQLVEMRGIGEHLATLLAVDIDIEKCNTVSSLWRFAGFGVIRLATATGKGNFKASQKKEKTNYVFIHESDQLFVSDKKSETHRSAAFRGKTVAELAAAGVVTLGTPIAERRVAGQTLHYKARLKTTVWKICFQQFLQKDHPYRKIYDEQRERLKGKHPEWMDGKLHGGAFRRMAKIFLAHLWLRWRVQQGLPTRSTYVEENLGHTHIHKPEEFGWPALTAAGKIKGKTKSKKAKAA